MIAISKATHIAKPSKNGLMRILIVRMSICVIFIGLSANFLSAQSSQTRYKKDPVNPQARALSASARRCVNNAGLYSTERPRVKQYFEQYYLPSMTDPAPQALGKIGKLHNDLFGKYIWPAASQAMQRDLTEWIVNFAKGKLLSTEYHPAVRVNAVLMLGKVDAAYSVNGGDPKPLPEATNLLIQIVGKTKSDPRITPALCSAALQGLERHARFHAGLPPEQVEKLSKALAYIVRLKKPLAEMDQEVHYWMQRQAASGLAALGTPGPKGSSLAALVTLASNKKMPLNDRCHVAAMLEKISLEGLNIKGKSIVEPIVRLTADVAEAAEEEVEEFREKNARGRRMRDEEEGLNRRQLLSRLLNLQSALITIQPLAGDELKSTIVDVRAAISPVVATAKDNSKGDIELLIEVRKMAESVATAKATFDTEPAAEEEVEFEAAAE